MLRWFIRNFWPFVKRDMGEVDWRERAMTLVNEFERRRQETDSLHRALRKSIADQEATTRKATALIELYQGRRRKADEDIEVAARIQLRYAESLREQAEQWERPAFVRPQSEPFVVMTRRPEPGSYFMTEPKVYVEERVQSRNRLAGKRHAHAHAGDDFTPNTWRRCFTAAC